VAVLKISERAQKHNYYGQRGPGAHMGAQPPEKNAH
jgi:hypothetical protein